MILRPRMPFLPSGPLRLLTQLKYASIPRGIGAYNDAGPLSGNVPPIVIDVVVTPGVAAVPPPMLTRAKAPGMHTASAASTAASATSALFTSLPPLSPRHAPVLVCDDRRNRLLRSHEGCEQRSDLLPPPLRSLPPFGRLLLVPGPKLATTTLLTHNNGRCQDHRVATQGVETVERRDVVRAERVRILSALLGDLDSLVEAAIAAIRAEIPAYAARDEIFADVKEQVAAHYRTKLTAFLEERTVALEEVAFIRGAATRRARDGLALEDYIAAYRVGEKVLWNAVVSAAGRSPEGQEAALTLAAPLMRYVDFVTTQAARAYVEFRQFAIAAAATSGESDAPHTVSGALARAAGQKAQPLVVVRRDEVVALAAVSSHADAGALSERVAAAHERLDAEGIPFAVAV